MRFSDKSVLITGGTSGLGEAAAKAFAAEGASVFFCGLMDDEGARVVADIAEAGGKAHYQYCDVRNEAALAAFIDGTADKFGRIDIAFNNAGVSHAAARFADLSVDRLDTVWRTNVLGVWYAMKHELKHMQVAKAGIIINTASILSKSRGGMDGRLWDEQTCGCWYDQKCRP